MPQSSDRSIDTLRQLQLMLCRQLEFASAEIAELNEILSRIGASERLSATALLGAIAYQRSYNPGGPVDSGQVFQAAIAFPGGFGAILWDSEVFAEYRNTCEPPIHDALARFIPFDSCTPTTQCYLLPQVRPLMQQLCRLVWPQ